MRKVQNGRCIANISKKSILANKKRNSILLAAIILTTVMLSTLFTVASSLIKSLETATCYQVGTYTHAGFKYLTQEEYDKLQIPLHRITDSASNGSVFPVVTEHFSASSDHAFL